MRFSIRRRSAKRRSSTSVEELRKDLREFLETVLPCFENRPSLYNAISKEVQELNQEICTLLAAGDPLTAFESPLSHSDDSNDNFKNFLPENSPSPNCLAKLQKDRMIIRQLWDIPQRKDVRSILLGLRDQIQADLDASEALQKKEAIASLKRLSQERELLTFVLGKLKDRRHIYLQVLKEMVTCELQEDEDIYAKSLHSPFSARQQKLLGSSTGSMSSLDSASSDSTSIHCSYVDNDAKVIEGCDPATSIDRWEDVSRLDELLDVVPETSLALFNLLRNLKEKYKQEAKELQLAESEHTTTPCLLIESTAAATLFDKLEAIKVESGDNPNRMQSGRWKSFKTKKANSISDVPSKSANLPEGRPNIPRSASCAAEIWV